MLVEDSILNGEHLLKNQGFTNSLDNFHFPRHRWYFYKEGFSPSLVHYAIKNLDLTNSDLIIDPFNGSGTTTLTASIYGYPAIGYEVNPFTSFLAKTKTLSVKINMFRDYRDETIKHCENGKTSRLNGYSSFTQHNGASKWLFNEDVLSSFTSGFEYASTINNNSADIIKLALISSIMDNANAYKDGKCLRYKKDWPDISYNKDSFLKSLKNKIKLIEDDLTLSIKVKPKLHTTDCRKSLKSLNTNFKLCITSPPYLNTFDYTDIYRPELFLGGFVRNREELYKLRLKTVRSHVQAKWKLPNRNAEYGMLFSDIINKLESRQKDLMHKNVIPMIYAYFEDLKNIFQLLKNKAAKNAEIWMVVSTSAYANIHVPVDLILADVATECGWHLKEIAVLREINKRKTRYSPDIEKLRESLIILHN